MPELDQSRELNPKEAAYYQSLIGILRWSLELGRIAITVDVSMMSSHVALPHESTTSIAHFCLSETSSQLINCF